MSQIINRCRKSDQIPIVRAIDFKTNVRGMYDQHHRDIHLNKRGGFNEYTVTHEFVHLLKDKDRNRGRYTSSQITEDRKIKSKSLEEAETTLEAAARMAPTKPIHASYYSNIGRTRKECEDAYRHDMKVVFGPEEAKNSRLKGKSLVKRIESCFTRTRISRVKL